ncbi:hypothetical protein [Oscillibacter sp. CU971]|uniref:hypothetical protein n=1 Tax=Oscillibacter sp. CU971 TaxID=2780102 RepID=UPI00195C03A0|nr:hypothetical protein [Oscillibacter sp. CU971]
MSKHTTLDQLKMLAQRSKTEIDRVDAKVTALNDRVDDIATVGGEPNVITEIKNNGTALAITDKGVDIGPSIAEAVAAADHLTKKKVTSVDDIDPAAEGADKFIYLVPKTGSDEDDVYDEYMVLDGKVEHVGNTQIDLDGYVQKEEGSGLYPDADKEKLAGIVMAEDTEVTAMLNEVFGAAQTEPEGPEVTEP